MNFSSFADRAMCVVFPRRCRYCGRVVEPREMLCESCKTNMPVIKAPICLFCGYNKDDCFCHEKKSYYDGITAPFYYQGAVCKAIDRMKFRENEFMCGVVAEDMAQAVQREYKDIPFDLITFVPFSEKEKKQREFNHSQLISQEISKLISVGSVETLRQIYEVPTQHSLGSEERKGNVFGIYEVIDKNVTENKTILLADDIKTTGATLNECAKMLKLSGAAAVYCVTFAITKKNKKRT